MNDSTLAIARLLALALSLFIIPSGLVPAIARNRSLSWRARLMTNWILTLFAAGLILLIVLWSTSLFSVGGGATAIFLVGAVMLMAVGWGSQYMAFNNSLEQLRVSLLMDGKEVPPTLMERVKARAAAPKCKDGLPARLVVVPDVTGTYAVSGRGMPVAPGSPSAGRTYSLTFSGLTAYDCAGAQGTLRPPARRFPQELVAWICAYGGFPRAKGKSCCNCGAELSPANAFPYGRIEANAELPNVAPFQLVYEGPAFTCPACWTRQIGSVDQFDGVGKAMLVALNNARIKEHWMDRFRS